MANMSYCRFENTFHDLLDCLRNIDSKAETERDERFRVKMVQLLQSVNDEYNLVEEVEEIDEDYFDND